jgi:peptidoglycan/xylan/chitin deacetylase (PgdA/CDA1 family)/GT2 family glycosyltransferase
MENQKDALKRPHVSVIIPAYNEETLLPRCLWALKNQDYSGPFETLVVDNASTDRTSEVAECWGARVVREARQGYVFALKRGTAEAHGEILLVTDADTIVPPDWVSTLVGFLQRNPGAAAVGGWVAFYDANWKGNLFAKFVLPIGLIYDRLCFRYSHLWGANLAVRREAMDRVGGWSSRFNLHADSELSKRLARVGKVSLLRDFCVSTSARRWNGHCLISTFVYALNFLFLHLLNRPAFFNFPAIRVKPAEVHSTRAGHRARFRLALAAGIFCAVMGTAVFLGIWPASSAYGKVYWNVPNREKLIALTFDDGPNEPATSQVLKVLKENGVQATFFLIGANVKVYPNTAREIVKEGNAIGNHSYSHPIFLALETNKAQDRQIDLAEKTIQDVTGVHCVLFRPPHGYKTPWLLKAVQKRGMVSVEWAEDSADWTNATSSQIVANVLKSVRPGNIILLHDGSNLTHGVDRSQTLKALPEIIKDLKAQGYRFVTIPELLGFPPAPNGQGSEG